MVQYICDLCKRAHSINCMHMAIDLPTAPNGRTWSHSKFDLCEDCHYELEAAVNNEKMRVMCLIRERNRK